MAEIGQHVGLAAWAANLDIADAGPLQPRMDRRETARIGIARIEPAAILHQRRKRQRLAAATRAEINYGLAGPRARKLRRELGTLVLNLDQAVDIGGLGMDAGGALASA